MSDEPLKVFVYGTLKPGERYHQHYCAEGLEQVMPAIARGQLYHLPQPHNYPAMTDGVGLVHGFLLCFAAPLADSVLSRLDDLEDYDPQGPSDKNLYERCRIEILDPAGTALGHAWCYIMTPETVQQFHGSPVEGGDWHPVPCGG